MILSNNYDILTSCSLIIIRFNRIRRSILISKFFIDSFWASKTHGFVPGDLVSLIDRSRHAATNRKIKSYFSMEDSLSIFNEDIEKALEGYTPAALRGANLHSPGDLRWQDIGGLNNVKDILVETLLWPSKVRQI